jgi:uncharacterized protein DUF6789
MRQRIAAGLGAGLVAGVILAVVMRIMRGWAPGGHHVAMIAFAATLVHAGTPRLGWLVYIAYGIVLGALYGAALLPGRTGWLRAAGLGGVWGLAWLVLMGVAVVPALLGERPLSGTALHEMANIGVPLLLGHIVYGLVLGAAFEWTLGAFNRRRGSHHALPGFHRAA